MELISDEMEKDQNVDGAYSARPWYNELQVGFEFPTAVAHSSRWAWVLSQAAS